MTESSPAGGPAAAHLAPVERPRRRWAAPLLLAVTAALHLALLLYFAPPRLLLSREPVATIDYGLHLYQVDRARRAFRGFGHLWSYDPQVLAGQPAGAIEDLSSKSLDLFVIAASGLGMDPHRAFNLYILLVHLLLPLIGYGAARLLGLRALEASAVALLWVLLWFFDSFLHWAWFCGMISWAFASSLSVLLVGLVYRTVETARAWLWLPGALLAGLLVLVHPYSALFAGPACAVIYLRRVRSLPLAHHAGVLLTVAAVVGATLPFWLTARRFWHYVMDSANYLRPGLLTLVTDLADLVKEPWDTGGGPVRTAFRFLCVAAAAVVLWRWRRARDPRTLPLGLLVGWPLLLAYAGGYLWLTRQIQPYRSIAPATLAAAIPAAVLLVELLSPATLRALGRPARLLLGLCLLLIVPRLATMVLYFMPEALPLARKPLPGASPIELPPDPFNAIQSLRPMGFRHHGLDPAHRAIREWLQRQHRGRGRVLVQDWQLGEYLAWSTELPIIGGIDERNVHHVDAHLFRWHPEGNLPGPRLREYLERYAIGFVVVKNLKPALEWRKTELRFRILIAGQRIYETRIEPSYFQLGRGELLAQEMNRLEVRTPSPDPVVLRFHWMETLRCRPSCRVERETVPGDRVGFIRIPDPPARFEIYNSYEL